MDQEKTFIDAGPPREVDVGPPPRVDLGPPPGVDLDPPPAPPGDFHDETDKHFLPFRGVDNETPAYLPLNPKYKQIRYLAVDPGIGDTPLSCFLGYVNLRRKRKLSRKIQYQAVSYRWGDIDDTVEITLRCAKRKSASIRSPRNAWRAQPFRVTRNLEGLLRAFRLQDSHRILWIDAICINQGDAAEKTHQVGDMSLIYSAASTVLVWLGEADLFSDIVIQTCKVWIESRLARIDKPADDIYWYLLGGRKLGQLIVDGYPFSGLSYDHWRHRRKRHQGSKWLLELSEVMQIITHSMDRCFSRPWFRRIWVLQEIILAPTTSDGSPLVTVYVGQSHIGWSELVKYADFLGQQADKASTYSYYKNLRFFEDVWSQFTTRPKGQRSPDLWLEDYLALTTAFTASDPRDRLFAILQLAQDTRNIFKTNHLLRPDYSKTLPQVLRDYRCWELKRFCGTLKSSTKIDQLALPLRPRPERTDIYEDTLCLDLLFSLPNATIDDNDFSESSQEFSGTEDSEWSHVSMDSYTDGGGSEIDDTDDAFSDENTSDTDHGKPKKILDQLALDYLIGPGMPKPATLEPGMPSWVTNVLDGRGNIHVADNFIARYASYNASGSLRPLQRRTTLPDSMSLRGHLIGQIWEAHTPSLTEPHQLKDLGNYLHKHHNHLWNRRQAKFALNDRSSYTLKDIHRKAIEKFGHEEVPQKLSPHLANRRTPNKSVRLLPETWKSLSREKKRRAPPPVPFTIGDPSIRMTRVYTTNHREFVLTSETAERGDIIVVIFGGRTPLLLRPEPQADNEQGLKYRFLGACFFQRDKWMLGKEADAGVFRREFDRFFELV